MKITMVKKVLADGSPCRKCSQVMEKLEQSGHISRISKIIDANDTNPDGEGALLASLHNVKTAPFFIVEETGKEPRVFTVYFKLVKDVLEA